jgi:hypothetical protein
MSGFHLVGYKMTFGRTAWQEMKYYRAQRAAMVQDAQSLMDTASSSIASALQNQVSGAANNAAQAALDRINVLAQATQTNVNKQIDQAQSLLGSSGSSVNTVA